jgi:PII-like signaling protein
MPEELAYSVIEIFTSEEARWHGAPLYDAIVRAVAKENSFARCIVTKGVAGCYEDGEIASHRVLDLSYNMPLKIEIVLPASELERILAHVDEMVSDGIVVVENVEIRVHRTHRARGERPVS